jgi:predicted DNA-binding transcriptional regulator AlpA
MKQKFTVPPECSKMLDISMLNSKEREEFFRPRHLARFMKVSEETIRNWRKLHYLPEPIKRGNVIGWFKSEILEFLRGIKGEME